MKAIKLIDSVFIKICNAVLITMGLTMIISATIQIVSRMIFNNAVGWTDELCRTTAVWATMFAAAAAVRDNSHVTMTMFRDILPENKKEIIIRICAVIIIFFACFTLIYGWKLSMSSMVIKTPGLGIKRGIIYLCIPISSIITIFNSLLVIFGLPAKFDQQSK